MISIRALSRLIHNVKYVAQILSWHTTLSDQADNIL